MVNQTLFAAFVGLSCSCNNPSSQDTTPYARDDLNVVLSQMSPCSSFMDGLSSNAHYVNQYHVYLFQVGYVPSKETVNAIRTHSVDHQSFAVPFEFDDNQGFVQYDPQRDRNSMFNGISIIFDNREKQRHMKEGDEILPTYTIIMDRDVDGYVDSCYLLDAYYEGRPACTYIDAETLGSMYYAHNFEGLINPRINPYTIKPQMVYAVILESTAKVFASLENNNE